MRVGKRGVAILLCVCALCVGVLAWRFVYPYFAPDPYWDLMAEEVTASGQTFDGPTFYNKETERLEQFGPMPEGEPVSAEYVRISITPNKGNFDGDSRQILLTPSNIGEREWLYFGSEGDHTIRRVTVSLGTIMAVSENADRGPVYVQVDIEKDGEWVFGAKQEVNRYENCQIILPKRSPYRLFFWQPEGIDWVLQYSISTRWW